MTELLVLAQHFGGMWIAALGSLFFITPWARAFQFRYALAIACLIAPLAPMYMLVADLYLTGSIMRTLAPALIPLVVFGHWLLRAQRAQNYQVWVVIGFAMAVAWAFASCLRFAYACVGEFCF